MSSKSKSILLRQKAVTYDADRIASCDILEDKGAGRLHINEQFKLTLYLSEMKCLWYFKYMIYERDAPKKVRRISVDSPKRYQTLISE